MPRLPTRQAWRKSWAEKLGGLGIHATEDDVLAPLTVLTRHPLIRGCRSAFVLGMEVIRQELVRFGVEIVEQAQEAEVVVIGKDPDLTYDSLAEAIPKT